MMGAEAGECPKCNIGTAAEAPGCLPVWCWPRLWTAMEGVSPPPHYPTAQRVMEIGNRERHSINWMGGGVWFITSVLNTDVGKPTVGSNPTPSASSYVVALL